VLSDHRDPIIQQAASRLETVTALILHDCGFATPDRSLRQTCALRLEEQTMDHDSDDFTIGTVAKAVGVNVETIRFYQRKGLLGEPERPQGSFRHYGPGDVARLRFIKSAQGLGFSLDEIAGVCKSCQK
jgi:hypothetical protein